MSEKTFSQDLFESNILNEKTNEKMTHSTNPFSFQSFIQNKRVEKSLTEFTDPYVDREISCCLEQCVLKSTNKQYIDNIPGQDVDFSEQKENKSDDDVHLENVPAIFDNPFSFKKFKKSQLTFSDKCSESPPQIGILQSNEDLLICPTYTEKDHIILHKENLHLRKSNFQLLKEVEQLHGKNASLSEKLYKLQQKDSEESKALEQVIKNVEANLDKANMRALSAENEFEKISVDYARLKVLNNVKLHEFFEQQAISASAKLRLASTEAEYLLNQLLLGAGNLRQSADFIESMHKVYELDK